jgi:hypothetical protein
VRAVAAAPSAPPRAPSAQWGHTRSHSPGRRQGRSRSQSASPTRSRSRSTSPDLSRRREAPPGERGVHLKPTFFETGQRAGASFADIASLPRVSTAIFLYHDTLEDFVHGTGNHVVGTAAIRHLRPDVGCCRAAGVPCSHAGAGFADLATTFVDFPDTISCGTSFTARECIAESILRVAERIAHCHGEVDVYYSVDGDGCWHDPDAPSLSGSVEVRAYISDCLAALPAQVQELRRRREAQAGASCMQQREPSTTPPAQ